MVSLQRFGLSYYENNALKILLKERVTPKLLSKKAGIPPGKVYSIIRALREKGLIEETESRPKEIFISDPATVLNKLIEQKQLNDELLIAEVRMFSSELARAQSKPSPFFQLGTTNEDNKAIQLRAFHEAKQEVCQILNKYHRPFSNRINKSLWEKAIKEATDRGVVFKSIYPEGVQLPSILQALPKNKFHVKRLNTDFTRCDIIDRKKVLIKMVHQDASNYGGIIFIEDERFARHLLTVFEQLWMS